VEDGKPVNHYFSIENVEHTDAAGILQTIEQAFVKKGLENSKDLVQTEPRSILVLVVEWLHLSKGNVRILLLSIVLLTDLSLLPIVLSSITESLKKFRIFCTFCINIINTRRRLCVNFA
jgi:hypothetical protein